MPDSTATRMSENECDELLDRVDSGVLSWKADSDEPPHSLPVSFGYDAVESTFYFRIADDPGSQKGSLAEKEVSFVTYDEGGGEYRSVIAQGTLESTTDGDIATETLAGLERVTIPLVDIFGEPPSEINFEFYRLVPERLTGRKETTTEL